MYRPIQLGNVSTFLVFLSLVTGINFVLFFYYHGNIGFSFKTLKTNEKLSEKCTFCASLLEKITQLEDNGENIKCAHEKKNPGVGKDSQISRKREEIEQKQQVEDHFTIKSETTVQKATKVLTEKRTTPENLTTQKGLYPTTQALKPLTLYTTNYLKLDQRKQQCVVPQINPLHPDIMKYVNFENTRKCRFKRYATITDGMLFLKLTHVQMAGLAYLRRIDDFNNAWSDWVPFTTNDFSLKEDFASCIRVLHRNYILVPVEHKNYKVPGRNGTRLERVIRLTEKDCSEEKHFRFSGNRIIHKKTGLCIFPKVREKQIILMLANTHQECSLNYSKFEVKEQKLQHVYTKHCIHHNTRYGLVLGDCNDAFGFYQDNNKTQGIDIKFKLTEEFLRVDIVQNGKLHSETHMHVLKPAKMKPQKDQNDNAGLKLNVVMLMVDSLSRANTQRQMKKTYEMLEKDPDSFILKSHTIVGDGTTAQLCAILTGVPEHILPEARRGIKGADFVDKYPFIFKDFSKHDYVTAFSEDDPSVGTFQFRLKGFKEKPTTKYLRPFWYMFNHINRKYMTHSCPHEFAFPYLKEFFKVYKMDKKLAFFVFSSLAHSDMNKAVLIDKDIFEFYQFLKSDGFSNNTAVILFGDHGLRAGSFRTTIQGKLEERLPLMSITLPHWIRKKFPSAIKNLEENSNVLTAHFDIHATLEHILTFPKMPNITHTRFGRSLFTNIASMNRTCADAGVESHWCPCLKSQPFNKSSSVAISVAHAVVDRINNITNSVEKAKELCAVLKFKNILRISKKIPNEMVQKFTGTYRNSECDSCGVQRNEKFVLKQFELEISMEVSPSDGAFEATVQYNTESKTVTVASEISRINFYRDQPRCIARHYPHLRKFCFCKEFLREN